MVPQERNAAAIWRQERIPVIYRPGGGLPLMARVPYARGNRFWLQNDHRRKPQWNPKYKCWEFPKAWFEDIVTRSLARFERVYVIQPFRAQEKCAPACWNAKGFECECSCMGANHGSRHPEGAWRVVSQTFALRWRDRELACRLIEKPAATGESGAAV
jgi:hypothetical protein